MAQERGIGEIRSPFIDFRRPPELDLSVEEQYFVDEVDWLPEHRFFNESIEIEDPVWGYEEIGNQKYDYVLIEIAKNDAISRMEDIEQLALPRNFTTIPNTSIYKRLEHALGSVNLTRKIIRHNNEIYGEDSPRYIDPETAIKMQIRTLLSDVAQWSFSHTGDWLFQKDTDGEDLHDRNLKIYLEKKGINSILRKYNIDPDEVIFPDVQDWVECDAPGLCVDRIDYSLREMRRWIPNDLLRTISADDFTLTEDGKIYMIDPAKAKVFAEAYLILSSEHWNEPVHRLQLELFKTRLKRIIATNTGKTGMHPMAQLLGSDRDFAIAMQEKGGFENYLDTSLEGIGKFERTLGWSLRRDRVERIIELGDEPDEVDFKDAAPHYPTVSVETEEEFTENSSCISIPLPHLKIRQVDPTLMVDGELTTLSEIDPKFAERLVTNRKFVLTNYVGKLAIAKAEFRKYIEAEIETLNSEWAEVQKAFEFTPEALDQLLIDAIRQVS